MNQKDNKFNWEAIDSQLDPGYHYLQETPHVDWQGDYRQPTVDDFLPTARKPRPPITRLPRLAASLPAATFCLVALAISYLSWRGYLHTQQAHGWSVSHAAIFAHGEYWRALTALFVHADMVHLLGNAYLLLLFDWFLRAFAGWRGFPIFPLIAGFATNIATVYFYPPNLQLVGASGMVYAMAGMWLILFARTSQHTWQQKLMRMLGFSLLVLLPQTYQANVSYAAHAIGFVIGLILGIVLPKPAVPAKPQQPAPD